MNTEDDNRELLVLEMQGARGLLIVAGLFVVIAGLKLASGLIVPVVVAFFLSVLSYPIMSWLTRHKIPQLIALMLTVLLNVAVVGAVLQASSRLLFQFQREIPGYLERLRVYFEGTATWLEEKGVAGATDLAAQMFDWQGLLNYATNQDVIQHLATIMGSTVGTVASVISAGTLVLILMIFVLMEARGTQGRLHAVMQAGGPDLGRFLDAATDIQKYLVIKTIISAFTGILAGLWCFLFDLPYAILWGILAFILNYIPAVGSLVAAIPPILVALGHQGMSSALGVMVGYLAINFLFGYVIEPTLLGRRFGVSALVIILSVVFWGWLWGPVGMFLAVPLTMMMKVLLENTEEFRWVSVAMAKKKVLHGEVVIETPEFEEAELIGGGAATEPPR